jgi:predicted small lipoprotein YifL
LAAPSRGYTLAHRSGRGPRRGFTGTAMRMLRLSAVLIPLLALALSACGNKGPLVKPKSPDTTPPPDTVPAAPAATPQDAGGH